MTDSLQTVPSKDFKKTQELGRGGFGIVHKGTWNSYNVAIKTLLINSLDETAKADFIHEAKMMGKLNNPNVIRLYGICTEPKSYAMIMELMTGGDLFHLLHDKKRKLPWKPIRWQLATDVCRGLACLHSNKILHRDLKSLNILLDHNLRAKITDFGMSRLKLQTSTLYTQSKGGSLPWMAPELFNDEVKVAKSSDIYALGMVLWEIASRKAPFSHIENVYHIPPMVIQGKRETIPRNCPKTYADLIQKCWVQTPSDRPSASQALKALTSNTQDPGKKPFQSGLKHYSQGQLKEALPYFQESAKSKYPPAYLYLHLLGESGTSETTQEYMSAFLSLLGDGIDFEALSSDNKIEAAKHFKWFQEQAKSKAPETQYQLALCYEKGLGVDPSAQEAKKYYTLAADQGHEGAKKKL